MKILKKIYSGDNVIFRPHSGQKPAFTSETFDTMAQLLTTVKCIAGLPHFSFRELKSSVRYKILLRKYEGLTFPSEKFLAEFDSKVFLMEKEYTLTVKRIRRQADLFP